MSCRKAAFFSAQCTVRSDVPDAVRCGRKCAAKKTAAAVIGRPPVSSCTLPLRISRPRGDHYGRLAVNDRSIARSNLTRQCALRTAILACRLGRCFCALRRGRHRRPATSPPSERARKFYFFETLQYNPKRPWLPRWRGAGLRWRPQKAQPFEAPTEAGAETAVTRQPTPW